MVTKKLGNVITIIFSSNLAVKMYNYNQKSIYVKSLELVQSLALSTLFFVYTHTQEPRFIVSNLYTKHEEQRAKRQ